MEKKTECHSYFAICSNGEVKNMVGFVANKNSDFDPDYITKKLGIEPDETLRMGSPRKNNHGIYPFSSWSACYQNTPSLDAEAQCENIVEELYDKIPALVEISREFDVTFSIIIVPHIYNERTPCLGVNKRIIDFCYQTGTEIGIDLYVYDKE